MGAPSTRGLGDPNRRQTANAAHPKTVTQKARRTATGPSYVSTTVLLPLGMGIITWPSGDLRGVTRSPFTEALYPATKRRGVSTVMPRSGASTVKRMGTRLSRRIGRLARSTCRSVYPAKSADSSGCASNSGAIVRSSTVSGSFPSVQRGIDRRWPSSMPNPFGLPAEGSA